MQLACLRCRSCGTVVVDTPEEQIIVHHRLEAGKIPHFSSRTPRIPSSSCNSYFIEKPSWLDVQYYPVESRLDCPKCKAKLGTYSWKGFPCSCGRWVAPAFSLIKSKVDQIYSYTTTITITTG